MGIKIKLSPLFVIFSFVLIFFGYFSLFLSYVTILLIHELTHYFVAQSRGYLSQSIKILPYGLQMTDTNIYDKNDEILIAISGPLANIILATIGVAVWWYFPNMYFYLYDFVFSNFVLGAYNLVPIYPLDGGRIVLALVGKKHKKRVLKIMHIVALLFAIVFVFIFIFVLTYKSAKNISYLMMSIFLISTLFDKKSTLSNSVLTFKNMSHIEVKNIIVNKNVLPFDMVKLMKGNYYYNFIVVDDDYKVIKHISQKQLLDYIANT